MIRILSGKQDAGKTFFFEYFFWCEKNADGFSSRKVFDGKTHIGYDLCRIKTDEHCPFIRVLNRVPKHWQEAARLGDRFSFSKKGFMFANKIAEEAIKNKPSWFFIDEIGPLEAAGKGFYSLFKRLLTVKGLHFCIVVRSGLVKNIIRLFNLKDLCVSSVTKTVTPFDVKAFNTQLREILTKAYQEGALDNLIYNHSKNSKNG